MNQRDYIPEAYHFLKNLCEGIVGSPVEVLYETHENYVSFMIVPVTTAETGLKNFGILIGQKGYNSHAIKKIFTIWSAARNHPLHWTITVANPRKVLGMEKSVTHQESSSQEQEA